MHQLHEVKLTLLFSSPSNCMQTPKYRRPEVSQRLKYKLLVQYRTQLKKTAAASSVDSISVSLHNVVFSCAQKRLNGEMSPARKDACESESRGWQREGSTAGQQGTRPRAPEGSSCQRPGSTGPVCVPSWKTHRSPQWDRNREPVFVFFFFPSVNTQFNFTERSDCTDDKAARVHQRRTIDVF